MKKLNHWIGFVILMFLVLGTQSCRDQKTYAEMKEEEEDAIKSFMDQRGYKVISEDEFLRNDSVTRENEYVELGESGVFMNIMQQGVDEGSHLLENGNHVISCRFVEIAVQNRSDLSMVAGDTLLLNMHPMSYTNNDLTISPDNITVTKKDKSFSGAYNSSSIMYRKYGTTAVPGGWLIPLRYLKLCRTGDSNKVARVRIIVPHAQGPGDASTYVYPLFYEITYNL